MESEPWDWIPHEEGADRQREINAYLSKMIDEMPLAKGPIIKTGLVDNPEVIEHKGVTMNAVLIIFFFYSGAHSQVVHMPTMAGCEAAKAKLEEKYGGVKAWCVENK